MLDIFAKNRLAFVSIFLILGLAYYSNYLQDSERKKIQNWADLNKLVLTKENASINEFKMEFNQSEWNFLRSKLNNLRQFKALNEKHVKRNEIGFDPEYAAELVTYWANSFNWSKNIQYINKYPQFKLTINNGITLHYLRVVTNQNETKRPIQLMLINGWPDVFYNFNKMIDFMNLNSNASYDIVVPSIPGFGHSTPLDKLIDSVQTSEYFDALMRFISDNENIEYFVHGEGWGSTIATCMAKMYPRRVKGIHITMPIIAPNLITLFLAVLAQFSPSLILSAEERTLGSSFDKPNFFSNILTKTGYFHYQATRPDTISHGLTDSPVGLLAYILETFAFGTYSSAPIGHKDGLLKNFNKDDLLSMVTYYWMTNSISSSIRLYRAHFLGKTDDLLSVSTKVPVGVQYFKNEVYVYPLCLLKSYFLNLKSFHIENSGGHFAGFENPELSAKDLINFVNV